MFDFIKKLMPREEKFFDMFEAHAAKGLEASRVMRQILDGGASVGSHCTQLMKLEDEADHISHDVGLCDPPFVHNAVRPFRHIRPDFRNGRCSRSDEQDRQGCSPVRT